ncbi:MAG: ribose 5-phosphate isomerase B [Alphaproteobacteria bacterium]|nr:ribose 5-phosphate isomerase B [Alphaproteobacteria bacterium]
MSAQIISMASDHRGYPLKALLSAKLRERGIGVADFGTTDESRCDAGDFAQKLVEDMRAHPERLGILICGTGQAMAMTANRYKHIRAALCTNTTMVRLAREHNDANVLVLGAHIIGQEVALDCLNAFLETKFMGGRFEERRDKLTALGGL